jgi:hypothetical protein
MNDLALVEEYKYSTDDKYYCPSETDIKGYR